MVARFTGQRGRPLGYRSTAIDPLAASVPERVLHRQVVATADLMGWASWHDEATNTPRKCDRCGEAVKRRRNKKGWPDLFLFRGSRLIVAELKSEKGRVSPEQQEWLDLFRQIPGVEVFVWKPSDWPEILKVLAR